VTALGPDAYRALEGVAVQGLPSCPGASTPSASPTATPPAGRSAYLPAVQVDR